MKIGTLVFLVLLPLLVFFAERAGKLGEARSQVRRAITPVTGVLTSLTLAARDLGRVILDLPSLVRENNNLKLENTRLAAELADKLNIQHENSLLRSELSLPPIDRSQKGIAAFIVGRSRTGPFGTFLINRGAKDGIREGQVALARNTLVGRIIEVGETISTLLPITNVNSTIPVTLIESRGIGLLKGGVRGLVIEEISRDVQVKKGEAVVTSSLGSVVPPGIFVGTVETVTGQPADIFLQVAIFSPVPFHMLELIVVLPNL